MNTDQVVAALTAEGYSRDNIQTVIDQFAGIQWRAGDEWNDQETDALRRQLGAPIFGPDLRFDTDTWATDLGRVLDRATGEKLRLEPDVLHRIAAGLLHERSDGRLSEAAKARLNEHGETPGRYDPDYSVERWADDLDETIRGNTNDQVRLSRPELQVAANLLLHASEGDWVPQAARLREQALSS